ncbi:5-formyltetrahydrofolate cyclo-ligase [Amphibacillus sp. Q70]|uniref:5-formyltetrahydrofolate cyclo-ligase n=1 Tax=Amphibacillus sp. Q70 TaxID=3453416 RepID=UPI003F824086
MSNIKTNLRNDYLTKLKQLSVEQRTMINHQLQKKLFQQPQWIKADTIGVTMNQDHEWETWPIIERAWQENKKVAVPKCNPKLKQMTFYQINGYDDLAIQFYNLMEPIIEKTEMVIKTDIDLLIVPGIVFDHYHYRIGHGGGYYDRFLADFKQATISLAWQGQVIEKIEVESFDQPVQKLIIADV